ncbi:hypothetical protein AB0442_32060 [Kitasatospora sp. NPDC085895]|uniref:beta-xylosidase family glycoside hydrolase n=1 Tax=Kitasatospora sp. NPDC085895 TaxID=3155057 RepID=UPI00344B66C1
MAGITAYDNTRNWYFLHLTADRTGRTGLRRAGCDRGVTTVDETGQRPLTAGTTVRLGLDLDGPQLRLRYDHGDGRQSFGPLLDATVLPDEHAEEHDAGGRRALGFTGAFLGLWARDLTGRGHHADFHDPQYRTRTRWSPARAPSGPAGQFMRERHVLCEACRTSPSVPVSTVRGRRFRTPSLHLGPVGAAVLAPAGRCPAVGSFLPAA